MVLYFSILLFLTQHEKKVEAAQEKQKADYDSRKKGVKIYDIHVGMVVLRRNLCNDSWKGGKMGLKWTGPYK